VVSLGFFVLKGEDLWGARKAKTSGGEGFGNINTGRKAY